MLTPHEMAILWPNYNEFSLFPLLRSNEPSSTLPPSTRAPLPTLAADAWESDSNVDAGYSDYLTNSEKKPGVQEYLTPPDKPATLP